MNIDIKSALNNLSNENEIFESEAQFQFELALTLNKMYPNYKVKLEVTTASQNINNKLKRYYTDIIIIDEVTNEYVAIELKYKTKKSKYENVELLEHGATDLGRFDFLWDIKRIEYLKYKSKNLRYNNELKCVKGFAILLTNEEKYWKYSSSEKDTLYKNFCISDKDQIVKDRPISWNKKDPSSCCINETWRDVNLTFHNNYKFKWEEYYKNTQYNPQFRLLLVEI